MAGKKIDYSAITNEILAYSDLCQSNSNIDPALYERYDVKRGLRDLNGKGVLTGLTEISEIRATKTVGGESIPCEGKLFYRGYNVEDLIRGARTDGRFGFEETVYLLLFGELPNKAQLTEFCKVLAKYRSLPSSFVRDVIMKKPSPDMMNMLSKCVLTLYSYDTNADDTSLPNVLRQCLQLISMFPMISVYGYMAYQYYNKSGDLIIHKPKPGLSMAENILHMLRADSSYTELEARVLDAALILHAEHGGGNNSTFTTHVVTSSGTDTYSATAAALGSLKGPKHGGANRKVVQMFADMKEQVNDWTDDAEVGAYLKALLHKEAFDRAGLIYGIGHAIYSVSDPRAVLFRSFVEKLSEEKGREEEFALYAKVEELAPKIIAEERKMYKGVSANVDFFSGFAYQMLDLPEDLYTPIFAIARIAGWSAHRMEELINAGKIIRPAYKSVSAEREYVSLADR
ncbi:MAG: citrate/2-methylcitrate synthase [Lachnospiraceae bacterium]|nr:citrate/2-methylcitrate synthase [Lachnospiraceae bacterium]MCR5087798.1 citrate/2-methylcitrate synthase [Lachnospiraceae bacterium]